METQQHLNSNEDFRLLEKEAAKLQPKISRYTLGGWVIIALGLIILGICVLSMFSIGPMNDKYIGSMIDVGAALLSLAGLLFIYVAFLGQQQQLHYQQIEIRQTQQELKGQREEMEAQNETLRLQRFENTFFQMLQIFNSIVDGLDLKKNTTRTDIAEKGRDCFKKIYSSLVLATHKDKSIPIQTALIKYNSVYMDNISDLSHYFRMLYQIIRYVDSSTIENKKLYIGIIRAQLSSYELLMLFYNSLHGNGVQKFKPLVEKHALLDNLDESLLLNFNHKNEYEPTAFGN